MTVMKIPESGGAYLLTPRPSRHRGNILILALISATAFIGFASFAVDLGRVQLVKSQLESAAIAAARNGASYLTNGTTAVQNAAYATAHSNLADGTPVTLNVSTDVILGTWDTTTRIFTTGGASPNAVKVIANRTAANGNAVPLLFAQVLGRSTCDVHASSIAMLVTAGSGTSTVRTEGIMNPWLAGMPNGNYGGPTVSGIAPDNSPIQVTNFSLTAGSSLTFSVTGSESDDPSNINQNWTPDGQPGGWRTNDSGYLNGMADLRAQQGSLVGVFLDNNAPNTEGAAPADTNYYSSSDLNFSSVSPKLRQPFFIGDGKTSGGATQNFVVPTGATRLYLGMMDNINWANNSGYFFITVNGPASKIVTVQ